MLRKLGLCERLAVVFVHLLKSGLKVSVENFCRFAQWYKFKNGFKSANITNCNLFEHWNNEITKNREELHGKFITKTF